MGTVARAVFICIYIYLFRLLYILFTTSITQTGDKSLHHQQFLILLLKRFVSQVQTMCLPEELGEAEVTSLCYNADSVLYTGTNSGRVCMWDCRTRRCIMTWEADEGEIGETVARTGNTQVYG